MAEASPVPAVTRDQVFAAVFGFAGPQNLDAAEEITDAVMRLLAEAPQPAPTCELVDGIPEPLHVDLTSAIKGRFSSSDEVNDWVADVMATLSPLIARALSDAAAAEAPQPKVLTEAEATWHQLADESPAGEPARWSAAVNAIVADSGKWDRWPENGPEGWWNARVAQSAIENLYRYGFAVVAVTPEARERIEADADRVVVEAPASPAPEEPTPAPQEKVVDLMAALEESVRDAKAERDRLRRAPEEDTPDA